MDAANKRAAAVSETINKRSTELLNARAGSGEVRRSSKTRTTTIARKTRPLSRILRSPATNSSSISELPGPSNARGQQPGGEQREPPDCCTAGLYAHGVPTHYRTRSERPYVLLLPFHLNVPLASSARAKPQNASPAIRNTTPISRVSRADVPGQRRATAPGRTIASHASTFQTASPRKKTTNASFSRSVITECV